MCNNPNTDITVCFVTVDRPKLSIRLVQSIREYYPNIRILVGEQIGNQSESNLSDVDAEVLILPRDYGVSASRNALVAEVRTPYFLLCDDDFVFGKITDLAPPLQILKFDPAIGVVGGLLYDVKNDEDFHEQDPRSWEKFFLLDKERRSLILIPIGTEIPSPLYAGSIQYFTADAVMNWAVMRTNLFHDGTLGWDPQLKITGEHEDFYLHRKIRSPHVKIVYCPSLRAYHNQKVSHYGPSYSDLRSRLDGWKIFSEKWGLDKVIDVLGVDGTTIDTRAAKVRRSPSNYLEAVAAVQADEGRIDLPPGAIGIDADGRLYLNPKQSQSNASKLLESEQRLSGQISELAAQLQWISRGYWASRDIAREVWFERQRWGLPYKISKWFRSRFS